MKRYWKHILLSTTLLAALVATVFVDKAEAKQLHLYLVIETPTYVVLSTCTGGNYNTPRTLTDGKRTLHIIHGPCKSA